MMGGKNHRIDRVILAAYCMVEIVIDIRTPQGIKFRSNVGFL